MNLFTVSGHKNPVLCGVRGISLIIMTSWFVYVCVFVIASRILLMMTTVMSNTCHVNCIVNFVISTQKYLGFLFAAWGCTAVHEMNGGYGFVL